MLSCDGESRSRVRYKLTLVTGLLECLCFAGVVFGWASLVFVLKTDGYFSDLCVNVTTANGTTDKGENEKHVSGIFMHSVQCCVAGLVLLSVIVSVFVRNVDLCLKAV